jgi:hypothetical protein
MTALAVVVATGFISAPLVARQSPGKALPPYVLQWGAVVTLLALLVVATELLARSSRLRALVLSRTAAVALAAVPAALLASSLWHAVPASSPRDPRSVEIESLTRALSGRVELTQGRFLVRVAPRHEQAMVLALLLALDKAGLHFGVVPFGSCRIEGHFVPRGDEGVELLIGDLPALPGAQRFGSADGLRVAVQLPWMARPRGSAVER